MVATFNSVEFFEPKDKVKGINIFITIIKNVNFIAGAIGNYVFLPVGYTAGRILLYSLQKQNIKLKKSVDKLIDSIPDRSHEELINIHLDIERLNRDFAGLNEKDGSRINIYSGILNKAHSILMDSYGYFQHLEATLLAAAYPDKQRQFSKQEFASLKESYKNCDTSDWEDDSLDIYQDYYSLNK